ncbi:uncharacterized protein LOC114423134 isoform X4 [Glycine soja]|uniref:uncharacterized protein LOC114423134 isoform X4 n=1 Tax=Glycine soja TaxID=3848 RepID=UPI00103BB989|nr:uncharacterized protein LOC114423134 isoform X4 [Glycine soja]
MATTLVSSAGGMLYSIIRVPLSLISLISLSLSSLGKLDNTTIIAHHHKNSKVIRGNSVVIIEELKVTFPMLESKNKEIKLLSILM